MRVATSARVSTLNGQHPEMQLSDLREYSARRGWADSSERILLGGFPFMKHICRERNEFLLAHEVSVRIGSDCSYSHSFWM